MRCFLGMGPAHVWNVFVVAIVLLVSLRENASSTAAAFTTPSLRFPLRRTTTTATTTAATNSRSRTSVLSPGLQMTGFLDDIGKFLDEMMMCGTKKSKKDTRSYDKDDDDKQDGAVYAGSTRLLTIPVQSIKPGGLRLFLMFYLLGMQNTPEPKSWKADQPTTEEYVLDMYYHDKTAALMVTLTDEQITMDRMGSMPSTSYLMQESVIVHGILDELQACATQNDDIRDQDRLLLLPEPKDAIEKARDSLAFG